jgi:peptidoglycan/xylan/chitin deacetylase (PgdA/CDA1 family)
MAQRGHELGNHTIFHPCRRDPIEPPSVTADWNNLQHFTEERLRNELQVSNFVLHLIDDQVARTYGNTCHNATIGPADNLQRIEPILKDYFVAARGERHERPSHSAGADLFNMGTLSGDGRLCAEWCGFIEQALEIGGMAIFTFHKVGQGYERLQVDEAEHNQLLRYLQQNKHVWTAPLIEIANWLNQAKR